jgi:t-SNARE complex subunit (syntaxin)
MPRLLYCLKVETFYLLHTMYTSIFNTENMKDKFSKKVKHYIQGQVQFKAENLVMARRG